MSLLQHDEEYIVERQQRAKRSWLEKGPLIYDNGPSLYYAMPATSIKMRNELTNSHKVTQKEYSDNDSEARFLAMVVYTIQLSNSETDFDNEEPKALTSASSLTLVRSIADYDPLPHCLHLLHGLRLTPFII